MPTLTLPRLRQVFSSGVLDEWRRDAELPSVLERLEVLTASGPTPSETGPRLRARELRARRAAWDVYVDAAEACGILHEGRVDRLRDLLDLEFRMALGECLASWLFAGVLGWKIAPQGSPSSPGIPPRPIQLRAPGRTDETELVVRVPFGGRQARRVASEDDLDLLLYDTRSAAHEFSEGGPNLLVLAPGLVAPPLPVEERLRLLQAAREERPARWRPDYAVAGAFGPPEPYPLSDGKFLRRWAERGWLPDRARVSAIVYIEERLVERRPFPWDELFLFTQRGARRDAEALRRALEANFARDNEVYIAHKVLVVHNPHAQFPTEDGAFGGLPQIRPAQVRSGRLRGPSWAPQPFERSVPGGPRRRRRRRSSSA